MADGFGEPRLKAALRCYDLAARRPPGSQAAQAAEQAIVYALSERRSSASADLLMRDVLHDGQRTVMRAERSRQAIEADLAHLSAAGVGTAGARAASGGDDVADIVIVRELLALLKRRASELGAPAPRVLAGMLVGESEVETATAVATSRSTVTRARRALRACAADAGFLSAA